MKYFLFVFALLLVCANALGWSGDVDKFVLSGDTIKLSAPSESGTAAIYDTCSASYNAQWCCSFLFDYDASSSNYCRWYVFSSSNSFGAEANGYFIRVGYSNKNIALCYQSGDDVVTLAQGKEGRVKASVPIHICVTRSETGYWQVWSKAYGEESSTLEAEAQNAAIEHNRFSGFWFKYSSTRSKAFRVWGYQHRGKKIDFSNKESGSVWIEPLTFTPDGDSNNDLAYIYYKLSEPSVANLYIYNADGVLVKRLLKNEALLSEGVVTWNGISDRGLLMPVGIYVVIFESFTDEKITLKKKLPFVLGIK